MKKKNLRLSGRLYDVLRSFANFLLRVFFKIEVFGLENVPSEPPFILAPTHRSLLDFLMLAPITNYHVRFMAKDSLFKNKIFKKFLLFMGAFPVNREGSDRRALKDSLAILEANEVLVVFPEGTREEGRTIKKLHEGTAYLSLKTGAPIVPIGIGGSDRIMPKGAKFIKPGKVILHIGEPLEIKRVGGVIKKSDLETLSSRLKDSLQRAYDEALEKLDRYDEARK